MLPIWQRRHSTVKNIAASCNLHAYRARLIQSTQPGVQPRRVQTQHLKTDLMLFRSVLRSTRAAFRRPFLPRSDQSLALHYR